MSRGAAPYPSRNFNGKNTAGHGGIPANGRLPLRGRMKLHTGHREAVRRHPRRECLRRTAPWKVWPARCRKPPQAGKDRRSKIPTVKCRPPTGCKRPEGPESRTARYQIGDIRSYLFNNITFYRAFLQSPHSRLPTRLPPPLLPGWMSRKSKPGGHQDRLGADNPLPARTGFFCLIQRIKSFSARILQRVSLRLSLQEYGDA